MSLFSVGEILKKDISMATDIPLTEIDAIKVFRVIKKAYIDKKACFVGKASQIKRILINFGTPETNTNTGFNILIAKGYLTLVGDDYTPTKIMLELFK